ncbi:baseplate assembly protein [Profundibacterium mesophilum]|uniref:Bacteriophage protein n=1 Tax=Profundibacterium mesophilum KAUST100406-0324 TaxID=1037889 RepID=A0A921NWP4_9RHOB|nr:baseplate J/gp47 family protein [Profundibacterium mesophilum]KAF0676736.1 putative bacteriophage protein [Profundibacterium mesophilum KAUST100406-0324]
MSAYTQIALERLPAPQVIEQPDFELLLGEMRAAAIAAIPEMAETLALESEPASKLLRVCAYYRMLDRAEFNDGARASMLALSRGTDLDHLAAFWGVERLVIDPGDPGAAPPVPPQLESDDALRTRTQLALEGYSVAGPAGAYQFWALSASGAVRDAAVTSPQPGEVTVTVLAHAGDGTPDAATLAQVEAVLSADDIRPLTDRVTVAAPAVIAYGVEAELELMDGPDPELALATAAARTADYIDAQRRLGRDIARSGLFAALHIPDVVRAVRLISPAADVAVGPTEVAYAAQAAVIRHV